MSFNEDQNRLHSGFVAQNIALINKIALNLLKNKKTTKVGIKNKRLKGGWDNAYLMKVLTIGLVTRLTFTCLPCIVLGFTSGQSH